MTLFEAIEAEDQAALRRLIDDGADVNEFDFDNGQGTPLEVACERGHEGVVEVLLAAGAKPDGGLFQAPIVSASSAGFTALVERLLRLGADPDGRDEEGASALAHAAACGFKDIARLLLEAGADPQLLDNDGLSPVAAALDNGHGRLAAYLGEPADFPESDPFWADANKRSSRAARRQRRRTTEPDAAPESRLDTSRYRQGFAVEKLDQGDVTRDFASVCHSGDLEIARAMLDAGLAVDWRFMGVAPTGLMSAARGGRLDVVELLLARGADVNLRDDQGQSALHFALMDPSTPKHGPVVERLLKAGYDPSLDARRGAFLIAMAQRWDAMDIVQMLLSAGAEADE